MGNGVCTVLKIVLCVYCVCTMLKIVLCVCFVADTMVCTGCCGVLDNVLTFLYRRLTRKTKKSANLQQTENDSLLRTLELNPEILQQVHIINSYMVKLIGQCNHQQLNLSFSFKINNPD